MNKLNTFIDQNYKSAIALKERFKQLEKNDWDSMTVLLELQVQIGHLYNVMNDNKSIVEQGRKIDNLGDEKISEWTRDDIISGILDYRIKNDLLTYITSSYTLEELASLYEVSKANSEVGKIKANKFILGFILLFSGY